MDTKPTCEELEKRLKGLEEAAILYKQAETALRAERDFANSLLNTAQAIILVLDTEGRIVRFNPYMEKISGHTLTEVQGKDWFSTFLPMQDYSKVQSIFQKAVADIQTKGNINPIITKDGHQRDIEWHDKTLKDTNGNVVGVLAIGQDITERKQMELQLIAAKFEAERANHAKSEFLARMSHELRTPLNAICGYSQLLQLDELLLDEEQREAVKYISEAGEHLLYLINEVLDIASIEAQQMRFSIEKVPLDSVFNSTLMLVKNLAKEKGVTINALPTEMPWVNADTKRLKQVMVNLLSNAIKYNCKKGTVTITFSNTPKGLIRINIIDTGIGIKPDKQDAVFEPFYRIKLKNKPTEGTGIGLSVVKKLVEAMDGRIGIKSEYGHGCTFWIELPQAKPLAAQLAEEDVAALSATAFTATQEAHRILYVEDNPASLALMQWIFKRLTNCELLSATTAEQGLNIAQEQRPDLILMDLDLPEMDGFEALKRLHANRKTADIPVIAVSAHAMPEYIEKGTKAGFIDYITKPMQVNQLIAAMQRIL